MIGVKIGAAALLFATTIIGQSDPVSRLKHSMDRFKDEGWLVDGKLQFPVADACVAQSGFPVNIEFCDAVVKAANIAQAFESKVFCLQGKCNAIYDAASGLCQCSWGTAREMNEDRTWPGKQCNKKLTCNAPTVAHWNPIEGSCACAINTFPPLNKVIYRFEPNFLKDYLYGPRKENGQSSKSDDSIHKAYESPDQSASSFKTLHASLKKMNDSLQKLQHSLRKLQNIAKSSSSPVTKIVAKVNEQDRQTSEPDLFELKRLAMLKLKHGYRKSPVSTAVRRASNDTVSLAPLPSYIPPPNTEVTQELIQESLQIQPQRLATVGSVVPHFADGVISFLVQLDGPISQTLTLNASDTLPCENIGLEPQPALILIPKTVKQGTPEVVLPNCLVIAVNMYDPKYITYWVQKEDGSVFSLLSDNMVHAIDQLDTSQPASIAIRVATPNNAATKRAIGKNILMTTVKRHQIYSVTCGKPCPFYHMDVIHGNDNYCGCMFKDANQDIAVAAAARGVEQPSPYTATMTAEACAAMVCNNNGGKAALFNPFTATCWCARPVYVEESNSAYTGGL